jgi:hypothetical protein
MSFGLHRVNTLIKNKPIKELEIAIKIPEEFTGSKYSFGSRSEDYPILKKRRQLITKEEGQPQFYTFPSSIGSAPGVKIDPSRSAITFVAHKPFIGPGSYDLIVKEKVSSHIMVKLSGKRHERSKTMTNTPGPGSCQNDISFNYLHPGFSKSMGGVLAEIGRNSKKDIQ